MSRSAETQPVEAPERRREGDGPARLRPATAEQVLVADAARRARKDIGLHQPGETLVDKVRGRAGEILAHEARPGSTDLNVTAQRHFPVYDLSDGQHMLSVKVRVNRTDGAVPVDSYVHDLRVALGTTKPAERGRYAGLTGPDLSGARLARLRERTVEHWAGLRDRLPTAVREAQTPDAMAHALKESAQLLIPADHVAAARQQVRQRPWAEPAEFGISPTVGHDELRQRADALAERIQPLRRGINSTTLDEQARLAASRARS